MLVTSKHQCRQYLNLVSITFMYLKKNEEKKIKQIKKGKSREQYAKIHLLYPCTTHFIQ